MAAGDIVQVGVQHEQAVGGMVWTKMTVQEVTGPGKQADVREVRDTRNAVVTRVYTNPGQTLRVRGFIIDTTHAELAVFEALKPGDVVVANSGGTFASRTDQKYLVADTPEIDRGAAETVVTLNLLREDSLAAAIDAVSSPTPVDLTA